MRVLVITPRFLYDIPHGGGPLVCLQMCRALVRLGHKTMMIEQFGPFTSRFLGIPELYRSLVPSHGPISLGRKGITLKILGDILERVLFDYYKSTVTSFDPHFAISISELPFIASIFERLHVPYTYWNIDDPWNFSETVIQTAKHSKVVFTISYGNVQTYKRYGIENVHWLPLAADPYIFRRIKSSKECDLTFVGNYSSNRMIGFKKYLFPLLRSREFSILIYGDGWPAISQCRGRIPYTKVSEIYSHSRLVLNIHRDVQRRTPLTLNMRLFEAMSCGSCVVSDYVPLLENIFALDRHLVAVPESQSANIVKITKRLLDDENRRERMSRSSHACIRRGHTFEHRMKSLVEIFNRS